MVARRSALVFASRLLVHERGRLLSAIGGVTFALLLMIMQMDFRNALLDSSLELLHQIDADVVVMHKEKRPFLARRRMPNERLYQALAVDGVEGAYPMWLALVFWKNLETGAERPIRLVGFSPSDPLFRIPEVNAHREALRERGTALMDSRSRDSYGFAGPGPAQVARREIEVIGTFPLGTDFEADGNLIVGDETFFELSGRPRDSMEIAAVQLAPGADPEAVAEAMRAVLPTDVRVFTKAGLLQRDLEYWESGTPLSIILIVGVVLGFAVGVVICYQILYTDVLDHLPQFATLKAMGYGNHYIRLVVVSEGWLLGVVGFVPSLLIGSGIQKVLGFVTGLPVRFSVNGALLVLVLSVGMCTLAGLLAVRKVEHVDPAELF